MRCTVPRSTGIPHTAGLGIVDIFIHGIGSIHTSHLQLQSRYPLYMLQYHPCIWNNKGSESNADRPEETLSSVNAANTTPSTSNSSTTPQGAALQWVHLIMKLQTLRRRSTLHFIYAVLIYHLLVQIPGDGCISRCFATMVPSLLAPGYYRGEP